MLPHADRAFELVDTTIGAERYFILGSYYQLKVDVERAITAYEALLRLEPTHYWALGNLGRLYRTIGRDDSALELRARQVEIRPRHFWGPYRLAEALFLKGDHDGAQDYAVRAANIASQLGSGELQSRKSWLEVIPACRAWLRDDIDEAVRIAHELEATLPLRDGPDREALTTSLGYSYLALGQRRAAERMFQRLPSDPARRYHSAVVAGSFADADKLDEYFAEPAESPAPPTMVRGLPSLDARLFPSALRRVDAWAKDLEEADEQLLRGQLALMRGRSAQARTLLGRSIDLREDRNGTPALAAAAGVARAWKASGDLEQAMHTLEEASRNRNGSCLWPTSSAHLWLDIRGELAQLYRQVGRHAEAATIEAQLRNLLRTADGNHPLLTRLNRNESDLDPSR